MKLMIKNPMKAMSSGRCLSGIGVRVIDQVKDKFQDT
jgi:hypothetical protein